MKLDIVIPVGPGHEQLVNEAIQSVKIACLTSQGPFKEVKIKAVDDTKGQMGRSSARNHAIQNSKAEWLFFLDADDLMHPMAMKNFQDFINYDAVWGKILEEREGCFFERYQIPEITDMQTLLDVDPYYTLQMGFFIKRQCMPLFDESMNTGEDWKAYLHIWSKYKCIKQSLPFMINRRGRHSIGPKSADGRDWMESVQGLIEAEKRALNVRQKLSA